MNSEGFGHTVRRLREQAGLSLRALADDAHIDAGHLSRVENGKRPPTPELAIALDTALQAGGALIAAAAAPVPLLATHVWGRAESEALAEMLLAENPSPENAVKFAHQWMLAEPPQVTEIRAGRRIGVGTLEKVEKRVHKLRVLDDYVGGLDTVGKVHAELVATVALLRTGSYTDQVGRRLLVAVTELCQLAGWVAADARRRREAEHYYLIGVRAGHAGGDTAVAANNLSSLSYLKTETGATGDAVVLARSAWCGARSAPATVRALLLERVAWAHARHRDDIAADNALGAVEEAYAERRADEDPLWVYWLTPDEMTVMEGRCWTELKRPLRAVPTLDRVIAGYNDDTARETALYRTWLAEALIQAREIDQAADEATLALELSRGAGSARVHERVHKLQVMLRPHRKRPPVAAFVERASQCL